MAKEPLEGGELIFPFNEEGVEVQPQQLAQGATVPAYVIHKGAYGKQIISFQYLANGQWSQPVPCGPYGATCNGSFQACAQQGTSAMGLLGNIPCDVTIQTVVLQCRMPNGQVAPATLKQPITPTCGAGYVYWNLN